MKGFIRVVAATMALGSASAIQAQTLPPASDVIARYITAIGGRDALLKVKSMTQKQTMELPAAGISADMEVSTAAPNLLASRVSIAGIGEVLSGFNGTVGWDVNPMAGSRLLEGKELEQLRENSDFYGSRMFPAEQYSAMEVLEQLDFNGEKAFKVKMTRKSGDIVTHYFSSTSGLLIGSEATQVGAMGEITTQTRYSDFADFGGLKLAKKSETTMGPNVLVMTVKSITFNDVPPTAFEVPASIKPLISK